MKITTRIAAGLALLTGLMVGVLAYQLRTVDDLQRINDELSRTNVEAARLSIRLAQDIEGVREFAKKELVWQTMGPDWQSLESDEPEYRDQWATWEATVIRDFERIHDVELGPRERQALRDLELSWQRYLFEIAPLRGADPPAIAELQPLLVRIDELSDELRDGVEGVIEANHVEVAAQAEHSAVAGEQARRVAWLASIGAAVLGFLICVILYLSISGPLRRLTRGTREVSEGRFEHRIPATGGSELSTLARDFNRMASRLDELEDMKRDFVSHVSHELKGPLAAIQETILVLLEQIPGPLNEKQAQLLALSRQSATRLSGMISNLLEVSRIEAAAMLLEPDWVEVGPLVRDVRSELTPLATDRDLEIAVREELDREEGRLAADPERMREVVGNLLENAIKFSPHEGRITLRATLLQQLPPAIPDRQRKKMAGQKPPYILLSVEDQGPGIAPEHREGVFEKFYQVKRGTRVEGQGVGLGLAICRSVVEAHGGVIWVEAGEDGGTRFMVVIPRMSRGVSVRHPPGDGGDGSRAETPAEAEPASSATEDGAATPGEPVGVVARRNGTDGAPDLGPRTEGREEP